MHDEADEWQHSCNGKQLMACCQSCKNLSGLPGRQDTEWSELLCYCVIEIKRWFFRSSFWHHRIGILEGLAFFRGLGFDLKTWTQHCMEIKREMRFMQQTITFRVHLAVAFTTPSWLFYAPSAAVCRFIRDCPSHNNFLPFWQTLKKKKKKITVLSIHTAN